MTSVGPGVVPDPPHAERTRRRRSMTQINPLSHATPVGLSSPLRSESRVPATGSTAMICPVLASSSPASWAISNQPAGPSVNCVGPSRASTITVVVDTADALVVSGGDVEVVDDPDLLVATQVPTPTATVAATMATRGRRRRFCGLGSFTSDTLVKAGRYRARVTASLSPTARLERRHAQSWEAVRIGVVRAAHLHSRPIASGVEDEGAAA